MNTAKLQAAAQSIMEANLEILARVHGTDVATVTAGLRAGHVKLVAQFKQLAERGAACALDLAREGRISLF